MSELADRLAIVHEWIAKYGNKRHVAITSEAIAALRSEPVAWRYKIDGDLDWQYTTRCDVIKGLRLVEALYALPSRETAKVVPVHSKSQYRRVAAQGGNPPVQTTHSLIDDVIGLLEGHDFIVEADLLKQCKDEIPDLEIVWAKTQYFRSAM